MRSRLLPLVPIGLLLLGACSTAPAPANPGETATSTAGSYPLTVDNCGTSVTFDQAPERVLAIKSTSIEMMLALGVADRLVGIAFPDGPFAPEWEPESDLEVISERVPSQEATLALEPDLVYAGWESNVTADGAGDRDALADLGVNTLVSPAACQEPEYQPNPLTWDDIFDEVNLVGDVFDVPDTAGALVEDFETRLEGIRLDERDLSALWYSSGTDTPFVGGGIGSPQLVLDTVGLSNIASDLDVTWSSLSWEAVVDAEPDVIVLVDSEWNTAENKIEQLEGNPATAQLPAVKQSRYLVVPFPAGEAGVRSVEAAETISADLAELEF